MANRECGRNGRLNVVQPCDLVWQPIALTASKRTYERALAQNFADRLEAVPALTKSWNNATDSFECLRNIGVGPGLPAIVQADNASRKRAANDEPGDLVAAKFPVAPDYSPQNRAQPELMKRGTKPEPSQPVGRPKQSRLHTNNRVEYLLRASELLEHFRRPPEIRLPPQPWRKTRVRKGVVSDLMPGSMYGLGDLRMTQDIGAALKECCANLLFLQVVKKPESSGAGPIVKGESYRAALGPPAIPGRRKELRRASSHAIHRERSYSRGTCHTGHCFSAEQRVPTNFGRVVHQS